MLWAVYGLALHPPLIFAIKASFYNSEYPGVHYIGYFDKFWEVQKIRQVKPWSTLGLLQMGVINLPYAFASALVNFLLHFMSSSFNSENFGTKHVYVNQNGK